MLDLIQDRNVAFPVLLQIQTATVQGRLAAIQQNSIVATIPPAVLIPQQVLDFIQRQFSAFLFNLQNHAFLVVVGPRHLNASFHAFSFRSVLNFHRRHGLN